ncbi:MAG: hypothetical protein ACI9F9_002794 [Candidatus Paceibacteria bacterium]|jgi:hypothetical protein
MLQLALCTLLWLPAPHSLAGSAQPGKLAQPQDTYTDEQVLKAWEALDDPTQEEISEWFRAEVVWLDTFQNSLIKFVLDGQTQDAGTWPLLEDAPYYDPEEHAPAQPIRRTALSSTSAAVKKKRKEFFFRVPERKLDSAWVYDYASRELKRVQKLADPDRIFRNGLNGFPPDHDLAEALIEKFLDSGDEQERAVAFGHAYTDRRGKVFTGLTLYDAWSSGARMEMPDVDNLGIVHELTKDWKSFKAPVSESKQEKLYDRVGELFAPLHQHRGLRYALAMCFLSGYPAMRDGYSANLDRLHALWDEHESSPKDVKDALPKSKMWKKFLESWIKTVDRKKAIAKAGVLRRDTLHNDGLRVRQKLVNIMLQAGFLGDN